MTGRAIQNPTLGFLLASPEYNMFCTKIPYIHSSAVLRETNGGPCFAGGAVGPHLPPTENHCHKKPSVFL